MVVLAVALSHTTSNLNKSSPPPAAAPAAVQAMKVNLTIPLAILLKMKTTTDLPDPVPTGALLAELHPVLPQQLPLLLCLAVLLALLEVEAGNVVLLMDLAPTLIASTLTTLLSGVKAPPPILFFAMLVVLAGFVMAP
jgi:hypothetical protein